MNVRRAKQVLTTINRPWAWGAIGLVGSVLVKLDPSVDRHLAVGHALGRAGILRRALRHFDAAVASARSSDRAADLRWLHPAQFASEHLRYQLGRARVKDPLFACRIEPTVRGRRVSASLDGGRFAMEITDNGFRLFGFAGPGTRRVNIELDHRVIRVQATGGLERRPEFTYTLQRSSIEAFPVMATVRVRGDGGVLLRTPTGGDGFAIHVPHGADSLVQQLGPEGTLDKKGGLPYGAAGRAQRRSAYLELYAHAREFFHAVLGRPLFLMYGTLLGCWRDGDLIDGDDDFDVAYVSEETEPERVKEETFGLIARLIEAGFSVSFNRRGRLFRVSKPSGTTSGAPTLVHLDVRPLWLAGGSAWAHNHFTMPSERGDWLPVVDSHLGETRVLIPRMTERFLESHYGSSWRVPDPGFTYYRDAIPDQVWAYLARALIQPSEYRRLRPSIDGTYPPSSRPGTFASEAWDDLYTL